MHAFPESFFFRAFRPLSLLSLLPPVVLVCGALFGPLPADATTKGSGRTLSETRAVSDFEAIAVSGSLSLEVRQTGRESVTVTADDNVLPLIETTVESGRAGRTLQIRTRRGESYRSRHEVKVVVEVARLTRLATSGAGDTHIEALDTPRLSVVMSGSGDLRLNGLATGPLELRLAGSGDVQASGRARSVHLGMAGSGDAQLAGLTADEVTVSIAGSGDAEVHADKALSVKIAGSGDVRYRGAVSDVRSKVAGSGGVGRF